MLKYAGQVNPEFQIPFPAEIQIRTFDAQVFSEPGAEATMERVEECFGSTHPGGERGLALGSGGLSCRIFSCRFLCMAWEKPLSSVGPNTFCSVRRVGARVRAELARPVLLLPDGEQRACGGRRELIFGLSSLHIDL